MKPIQALVRSMVLLAVALAMPAGVQAHCDSLDGPVVRDAREALERGDVTPVLKWVRAADEAPVREAFAKASAVRQQGPAARELADRYFFETLVRLHRAGEGEPFTGLKPAGSVDPGIAEADRALESGSGRVLAKGLGAKVQAEVERRYALAAERRRHAGDSVAAGRAYVEAYVDYIHFVETMHAAAEPGADHRHHDAVPAPHD